MKTTPQNQDLDLVFLIDRSGSMYGSEEDTMGGFNSFIDKERKNEFNTNVTTILFAHDYEMLYKRKSINNVGKLTSDEYRVGGSTALLDAIGRTITSLNREIDNKVLFVIITDGMENSSVEYSMQQIKNMIENHNWEFIFLGADIDSYSEAHKIGIKKSRVANYCKSQEGFDDAFLSVENASRHLRMRKNLDKSDWNENLRKYD